MRTAARPGLARSVVPRSLSTWPVVSLPLSPRSLSARSVLALSALCLPVLAGCGARSPAAVGPAPLTAAALPSPLASALASAVPFAHCPAPAALDHPSIQGVQWNPGTAAEKNLSCQLSFGTVPRGGSLEVSFEASSTPQADVRDRLGELRALAQQPGVVSLPELGDGGLAAGVAFTGGSGVRYLLHAGTARSVVTVVCVVPTVKGRLPAAQAELAPVARELLRWVLAHQPAQG